MVSISGKPDFSVEGADRVIAAAEPSMPTAPGFGGGFVRFGFLAGLDFAAARRLKVERVSRRHGGTFGETSNKLIAAATRLRVRPASASRPARITNDRFAATGRSHNDAIDLVDDARSRHRRC
jgi:hypothetical protein